MKRILVIHQGKRDDYQVVKALIRSGHDVSLVTDGYSNAAVEFLARYFSLKGLKKLANRKIDGFAQSKVSSDLCGEIFYRILGFFKGESFTLEAINSSIASRAVKKLSTGEYDLVLAYNYNAFKIFNSIEAKNVRKVLFQCHPCPLYIKEAFYKYIDGGYVERVNSEKEFSYSDEYQAMLVAEPLLADRVICASTITAKSLLHAGVNEDNFSIIPYGVGERFGRLPIQSKSQSGVLSLIFVGQFTGRKGLIPLFNILNLLRFPVKMRFVGRGNRDFDPSDFIKNKAVDYSVHWDVSDDDLLKLYAQSDVFIFPSLLEGFGHVVLEAMLAGCIPVVSDMTCGPDVIDSGVDGFVYAPYDIDGFVECLSTLNSLQRLDEIKSNAREKAKKFTWVSFQDKILNFVNGELE